MTSGNCLPDCPPPCADWKSASLGTLCRASACADASGRRRPTVGYGRGVPRPFSRHAGSYEWRLFAWYP